MTFRRSRLAWSWFRIVCAETETGRQEGRINAFVYLAIRLLPRLRFSFAFTFSAFLLNELYLTSESGPSCLSPLST